MHDGMETKDTWIEHRRLILKSLEDLWACRNQDAKAINDILVEIAVLKVKAGVWGVLGGAIVAGSTLLFVFLRSSGN